MKEIKFLIHYGELGLKGKNRKDFEYQLRRNLKDKVESVGDKIEIAIKNKYLTLTATRKDQQDTPIASQIGKVFGIKWFAAVETLPRNSTLTNITKAVLKKAKSVADSKASFKIDCKRADKTFETKSDEVERKIGAEVIKSTDFKVVNLSDPNYTFYIEINSEEILVFSEKLHGLGGLPVGSSGRILTLLSGGIDSPVAAFLMAKRGCNVDFLHFYVNKPENDSKIIKLAKQVSQFTGSGRLFLAPYLPFNMNILEVDTEYELVLFRRFILRIAERLCKEQKIHALSTGDNLGQVASQTLENISATDDALENLVCFRPLIGFDKEEIIKAAQRIGTYFISNQPSKDCCSIIDRHARTRVGIARIQEEEMKIKDYEKLIKDTMREISIIKV